MVLKKTFLKSKYFRVYLEDQWMMLSVKSFAFVFSVCGSHHRAAGHQRQKPAVHRVRDHQQRQDPRQGALRRGGGRLVAPQRASSRLKQAESHILLINSTLNGVKR